MEMLKGVFFKVEFWRLYGDRPVNAHQREMLNRLLDGWFTPSAADGGGRR